jgi:hypothetical protein
MKRKYAKVAVADAKRDAFLEALRTGASVMEACAVAGWANRSTYDYHRRVNPLWAAEVDLVRETRLREKPGFQEGSVSEKERSVSSFAGFAKEYFPDRRPHLSHQLKIIAELQNLRPREVCLILLWPEAGKTSTIEDHICSTLAQDPGHRFRVVSEAGDLSKRIVGTCKRRFTSGTDYPKFIAKYGPFYEKGQERQGRPWTTEQISILANPGTERDYNLVASSWTAATYGSRIDTLILDDIQSQNNYNQAEQIFRTIRGTFFNRGLEMRTLIVGTRIGSGDFYERMMEAGLITRKVLIPAANLSGDPSVPEFWDQHTMVHDGGPCCQGNFRQYPCPRDKSRLTAREFMELIRFQSGEDIWWAAYQQNPVADERTTFGALVDRCKDVNRLVGQLPA